MQDKFWVNPDKPLSPASTPTVPKVTPGRVLGLHLPFLPSRALLCWSQPPTSGGLTPCCAGGWLGSSWSGFHRCRRPPEQWAPVL